MKRSNNPEAMNVSGFTSIKLKQEFYGKQISYLFNLIEIKKYSKNLKLIKDKTSFQHRNKKRERIILPLNYTCKTL